jgi:hypothetical protein
MALIIRLFSARIKHFVPELGPSRPDSNPDVVLAQKVRNAELPFWIQCSRLRVSLGELESVLVGHFLSVPIARGRLWNARATGYSGNGAASEFGSREIIEDVVHFFVSIDTMLALKHTLDGRDPRGYKIKNGQFETSYRPEFRRNPCISRA